MEDTQKIKPFLERLCRKPPSGDKVISPEWKLAAGKFYELDCVSDIVKGHHQIYKEKIKTENSTLVLLRSKRVLQVPLIKLLALAISEINWSFSLRSLMTLRPKWILLPSQRYLLGCLCHHY